MDVTGGTDGWFALLSQQDRGAVVSTIVTAFPKSKPELRRVAEAGLVRAIENARVLSEQGKGLNARRLRTLADAGNEFQKRLKQVGAPARRFRKLLTQVPLAAQERLVERMIDGIESDAESSAMFAVRPRFSLSWFISRIDELTRTLLLTGALDRAFASKAGPPRKEPEMLLALEIASAYTKLSSRRAAGIATDWDSKKPSGARYDFAVEIFKVAFPLKKPPDGIIKDAFVRVRDLSASAQLNP